MRRIQKAVLGIALMMLCSSQGHAAMGVPEDLTHRWGAGFNLSLGVAEDADADAAFYGGGLVSYGVEENWVLQVDVGYLSFSERAHGVDYGDLDAVPLVISLQWRQLFTMGNTPAAWYPLVGVGVMFLDLSGGSDAEAQGVPTTVDNAAFIARFGGGLDVFFADHLAWNLELSYTYSDTDVKLIQPITGEGKKNNTDFWLAGSGIRYYF